MIELSKEKSIYRFTLKLGAICFASGTWPFDWNIFPGFGPELSYINSLVVLSLLFIYWLVPKSGKNQFRFLVYSGFLICSCSVSTILIMVGQGLTSLYYAGNIMVIFVAALTLRNSLQDLCITMGIIIAVHFSSCLLFGPWDIPALMTNVYFFSCAVGIALICNAIIKKSKIENESLIRVFAHDVKNKLLLLQVLLRSQNINRDKAEINAKIEIRKLFNLAGNLLNILNEDDKINRVDELHCIELVRKLESEWRASFEAKEIFCTFECETELSFFADTSHMDLVLSNLLANALSNTPGGGNFCLKAVGRENTVELRFINSGQTIPPELSGNLFKKHLANVTHTAYSKGLGLYYSKNMVEKHGGNLEYRVTEDGKNEFAIRIPASVGRIRTQKHLGKK